jgi:uncharacterized protein YdhG (YjbR/CyaY superfamily)
MKAAPATIDEFLTPLPADQRAALEALRRQVLAAAPGASECISYGMPAFRQHGVLVWMGAGKAHCALYPSGLVEDFKHRLEGYETSKGAIRFQPDRPLPADLVRDIVARRVAEDAAKAAARPVKQKRA